MDEYEMEEETIISENEIPELLTELSQSALNLLENDENQQALEYLSQSEELLEAVATQGGLADPNAILVTLHNTAYTYQKLSKLQDCAKYLDGCIYNASSRLTQYDELEISAKIIAEKVRWWKYQVKTKIQLCAVLSQIGRHDDALVQAKDSLALIKNILNDLLRICNKHLLKNRRVYDNFRTPEQNKLISSPHFTQFNRMVNKANPILNYLTASIANKNQKSPGKRPSANMEGWLHNYSISDVMLMKPIRLESIRQSCILQNEISEENLVEIVWFLAATYFCISTESRFISDKPSLVLKKQQNTMHLKDAENWHRKSLVLLQKFIPTDTPLYKHILSTYKKYFGEKRMIRLKHRRPRSRPGKYTRDLQNELKGVVDIYRTWESRSNSFTGFQNSQRKLNGHQTDSFHGKRKHSVPNVRPPSSERPKNYVSRKGAHSESRIVRSPSPVNTSFPISQQELEEKLAKLREERDKKTMGQMDEYLNIEYDRL